MRVTTVIVVTDEAEGDEMRTHVERDLVTFSIQDVEPSRFEPRSFCMGTAGVREWAMRIIREIDALGGASP